MFISPCIHCYYIPLWVNCKDLEYSPCPSPLFLPPPSLSPLSLSTFPPQAIRGTLSQEVLEDAKVFMQEELLRKAAQKTADQVMDAEKQR